MPLQHDRRQRELGAVRAVDDIGQQRVAQHDADDRADAAGGGTVDRELLHDVRVTVAEGLERAGVDALLIDHARHRGRCHEGRDQIEEIREDIGKRVDDLGDAVVGLVALGARGLATRVDAVRGLLDLVTLGAGGLELGLGLGDLLLDLGQLLVVRGEAVLVFGFLARKLLLGRLDLGARRLILPCLGRQGRSRLLPLRKTVVVACEALVVRGDAGLV